MDRECENCVSTNIYRRGRCQTCYRYYLKHDGKDRPLTMEQQARILRHDILRKQAAVRKSNDRLVIRSAV